MGAAQKPTILLVEDDEDIAEILGLVMPELGYGLVTAVNGEEALALLRGAHERPRLILLDLMMPVMDGWTFYNRIRSDDSGGIPVVILSSADAEEARRDLGAETALSKPFEIDDVVDRVRGLLPA
jgi:two-component system, chemotaxis family, chemotaxis protein CheY